jgi:hypothetical protein
MFLPHVSFFLANMAHSRLLCFILPQSDIFHIPYGHGCLADVSSFPNESGAPKEESIPMAISEAKLEANRRNAMRSCGPRSEVGKNRSKLNAVKHGMKGRDAGAAR